MKRILSLYSLLLIMCFTINAQGPKEYFNVETPLTFNGTEYRLAYSAKPNDRYLSQEYLPTGETFDDYTSMFTISLIRADISPEQAVKSKKAELDERKKNDPVCNYMVVNRGNEYMLDFLVSDAPTGDFSTVEFDVHRYLRTKIDGEEYLVLLFFSERAYGDDITDYMRSLKDHRPTILSQMGTLPLPTIHLAD